MRTERSWPGVITVLLVASVFLVLGVGVAQGARHGEGPAAQGRFGHSRGPAGGGFPSTGVGGRRDALSGRVSGGLARGVGAEIPAFRTQTSRTFVGGDGAFVTRVYSSPVNYRDAQGGWRPIDDSLVASGSSVVNRADAYRVVLPGRLSSGPMAVSDPQGRVSLALVGGSGSGSVRGTSDVFANALPGVSVDYTVGSGAVKDALSLAGPASPSRFVYDLGLSAGLSPQSATDGSIDVRDMQGRTRFVLLAPFMVDAARRSNDVGRVSMRLMRVGAGWRVMLAADRAWLAAPGRRWPVTIDPTVSIGPAPDCRLELSSPTSSYCANATDDVEGGSGVADHTLLHFNVQGALPADSNVLYATANLYLGSWQNSTTTPGVGLPADDRLYVRGDVEHV